MTSGKPKYFGFCGLGSWELSDHWVPVPSEIDDEDRVYEELARLERCGVPHRVLRYRKGVLMVEKKVEFVN